MFFSNSPRCPQNYYYTDKVKTFFKKIFMWQLCWIKVSAQNQTRTTPQDASDPLKTTTATSFIFHIQCCPPHLLTAKLVKLILLEQRLFWNHSPLFWTEHQTAAGTYTKPGVILHTVPRAGAPALHTRPDKEAVFSWGRWYACTEWRQLSRP